MLIISSTIKKETPCFLERKKIKKEMEEPLGESV